jgi:hypothetical protein
MGSVLGDFIFPTGLAQRTGEYRLVGQEVYTGRGTLVVEYFRYLDGPVIDRIWLDAATGVILHYVNFGKPAGGPLSVEITTTAVQFDGTLPEAAFILGGSLPDRFAGGPQDIIN